MWRLRVALAEVAEHTQPRDEIKAQRRGTR